MQISVDWVEIALRLSLSMIASAVIGINRGEEDRPVGLRTTMLVTLAATISMVQVNLLLPVSGKTQASFATMDLMRLPLGILSGMGFIGAGAIIRRDDMVQGVTSAATLWFATVMGLCFGGGQIGLGLIAFGLAILVLSPLKKVEYWSGRQRRGTLSITTDSAELIDHVIAPRLAAAGLRVGDRAISCDTRGHICTARWEIRWQEGESSPAELALELSRHTDVTVLEWVPLKHS